MKCCYKCCSPNVSRICRFCLASGTNMKQIIDDSFFQRRSKATHQYQINMIQQNSAYSQMFGLKFDSPLNNLDYFHTSTMLPPDIMHDLLEGIVPLEIKLSVENFIQNGFFSLDDLNSKIRTWNYGPLDILDKPPILNKQIEVKGNAASNWCLLRMLPMMIGCFIPIGNEIWEMLMLLKDIVDIVFAPKLTNRHVSILDTIIKEHHNLYLEHFGDIGLKPKHNFLIHYPRLIIEYGPLIRAWCMRFEAKHHYFKRVAQRLQNFKTFLSTLANRHQMKNCYKTTSSRFFKKGDRHFKIIGNIS